MHVHGGTSRTAIEPTNEACSKIYYFLYIMLHVILSQVGGCWYIINPRRACARVTVLGLSVCVCFPCSGTSRNQP